MGRAKDGGVPLAVSCGAERGGEGGRGRGDERVTTRYCTNTIQVHQTLLLLIYLFHLMNPEIFEKA